MLELWIRALEDTSLSSGLRMSIWVYPLVNTGHILGIALLVGGTVPLHLRFLGVWKTTSASDARRILSRTADIGLFTAVIFGFLLFSSRASDYADSGIFISKMIFLIGAFAGTLVIRLSTMKGMTSSGGAGYTLSLPMKILSAALLGLWIAVLALGRFIAYF